VLSCKTSQFKENNDDKNQFVQRNYFKGGTRETAVSLCSLGGLAFLGGHFMLIMKKAWLALGIGWALCIALLIGAVALAPIVLLFMV
jgi:hypothetical protein